MDYYGVDYFVLSVRGMPGEYADDELMPLWDGKYGYSYINTRKIIIPPQFWNAQSFSEGLAAVEVRPTEWGYINKTGQIAIEPRFRKAEPFSEGLAAVALGPTQWGYINKTGQMIIAPQFLIAEPFKNGQANVMDQAIKWHSINKTGQTMAENVVRPRPFSEPPPKQVKKAGWDFYATVTLAQMLGLAFIYWTVRNMCDNEQLKRKRWLILLSFVNLPLFTFSKWGVDFTIETIIFLVICMTISLLLAGLLLFTKLGAGRRGPDSDKECKQVT